MPCPKSPFSYFEPFEAKAREAGARVVAGVDEVGRGPLAGPVVAAAVVFRSSTSIPGVNDSKKLTARAREELVSLILREAVSFGLSFVYQEAIDELNIREASLLAMSRAVSKLRVTPDCLLIDGRDMVPGLSGVKQTSIIKGDSRCFSIAAASIIAKVARDRLLSYIDRDYPEYGFSVHKGYGTKRHLAALAEYGVTPFHRQSFAPVRERMH